MLDKRAAARASGFLTEYSAEKDFNEDQLHRKRSYAEEYKLFVKRYGLEWRDEENR